MALVNQLYFNYFNVKKKKSISSTQFMKRFFPKQKNDFLFECLSPFVYFDLAALLGAGHWSAVVVAVQLLCCV